MLLQYLLVINSFVKFFCEVLSNPHLFPYGKFGFQTMRQTPLSGIIELKVFLRF